MIGSPVSKETTCRFQQKNWSIDMRRIQDNIDFDMRATKIDVPLVPDEAIYPGSVRRAGQ